MAFTYTSFDSTAEINGDTIRGVLAAFHIPQQAGKILELHGLPAQPQPGVWYSMQAWLNVLSTLETSYGEQTVYAAGLQIVHHSLWPATVKTLAEALQTLEEVRQANMRGNYMGYYRLEEHGPRAVRVVCSNPSPNAFDHGLLTGLARKFRPPGVVQVRVTKEETPADFPATLKWFRVSW